MAVLAESLWRDLEAATGRRLLHVTGQLTFGDGDALTAIATALAARGRAVEVLAPPDAARRFPDLVVPGPALYEPDSGVLAADECLAALRASARFELRTGRRVTSLVSRSDSVAVTTSDGGTLVADIVVDCAGPLALALLDDHLPHDTSVQLAPSGPQVAYFLGTGRATTSTLPVFIEWGPDMIYGLPVLGSGAHAGAYKVSHHTPGAPIDRFDPVDPSPWDDDPALLARLTGAVSRLLPALDPEPVATERCVYDNSADQDFVLDRVGGVVVGCGTSGHGFKFGPLFGELLADLAEGRNPRVDVSRFRLDRPASTGAGAVATGR